MGVSIMTCQEFNKKLVDYIDGNMSFKQKKQFNIHLKNCTKCSMALLQYQELLDKLHKAPEVKCPDHIVERIFHATESSGEKADFSKFIFSRKLGIAAAIAIIVICTVLFFPGRYHQKDIQPTYSTEEIIQAKKEAELALGYFHFYTKKAETIIADEAFSKPIVDPIKLTMIVAFNPLLNGGKL